MRTRPDSTRMVRLYGQHQSLRTVARLLGCSPTTVRRHLAALGVARRPPRGKRQPRFTAVQTRDVIARYQGHQESLATIAGAYSCSRDRIRRLLEHEGVPVRPRGRPRTSPPSSGDDSATRAAAGGRQHMVPLG